MSNRRLTLPAVRDELSRFGVWLENRPGEYVVYLKEKRPEHGRTAESLAEALALGLDLALTRTAPEPPRAFKRITKRQFIRRHNLRRAKLLRRQAATDAAGIAARAAALADFSD